MMETIRIHKKSVQRHFDRYAEQYDRHAVIQARMADRLLELVGSSLTNLQMLPREVHRIVEIGCGTGRLTAKLLEQFPNAKLLAIDLAPRMLELTIERCKGAYEQNRLEVWLGDAERCLSREGEEDAQVSTSCSDECLALEDGSIDLIVSSAAFQWFTDPEAAMSAWLRKLAPSGQLAFSTFGPETFRELHDSFRRAEELLGLQGTMRRGQHFLGLRDWEALFSCVAGGGDAAASTGRHKGTAEFELSDQAAATLANGRVFYQEECLHHVHYPDVRSFLYSVKETGASSASHGAAGGSLSRRLLKTMEQMYEHQYRDASGVRATYHVVYGILV
ncbi:methyltransferase domain-containing protein [Paenibacillus sp. YYML68]|uniref:methyltransferase domain-containing protein n=1 Tax=Paenibacillus sp. YYML68 TaxID=2909250 RepID=UPI00249250E8|nr:methyltransferase domain-containing protein [Paenibacillus sp. YYML68]